MKTVYYIRHAKSSWADPKAPDHDRPLNSRGERDAPRMAQFLKDDGVHLDGLISSTAMRAKTTAIAFAGILDLEDNLLLEPGLYHAPPFAMIAHLQELPAEWDKVALFAHNPGMTQMANLYSPQHIDNVPTCGVFAVRYTTDEWSGLADDHSNGEWMDMWAPKTIGDV